MAPFTAHSITVLTTPQLLTSVVVPFIADLRESHLAKAVVTDWIKWEEWVAQNNKPTLTDSDVNDVVNKVVHSWSYASLRPYRSPK